jgi:hypothetical protein
MAIYHFSGQILGRSPKQNPDGSWRPGSKAVAAAAYRSGTRLDDHTHRQEHDYSRRKGVVHAEVLTPPGSAPWLTDRALLWNTVEAMETRKDAQLAREFNMALPHELTHEQRLDLVRDFVERHFVGKGMVADLALHDPDPDEGQNAKNFHAHVMLTLRRATPDGLHPVKTREWNSKELLAVWRSEWALACNVALERAGKRQRVDHRTLVAQRDEALARKDHSTAYLLNRQPEIHVGPRARQQVREGRAPQSRPREVGPKRRTERAASTQRRVRDYGTYDRGTRLNWLERIVVGNNDRLKRDLRQTNHRFDRLSRKLDYWQRRTAYAAEGAIMGRQFRFNRWKAAEEDKRRRDEAARKVAQAKKRLSQIAAILKDLELAISGANRQYERGLIRAREVEGWMRSVHRSGQAMGMGRGRTRRR